nr:hypothetical protein [Halomonas lutea]
MGLYLVVVLICLLVVGGTVGLLMMVRTPRYRTEPDHLLKLFDRVLAGQSTESEWHAIVGYPIRHDAFLEGVRRKAQQIMDEHGRPWQVAQGGSLLSRSGREELQTIRNQLASRIIDQEGKREF